MSTDPHVERLRQLFLTHPAWLKAASSIRDGSSSRVLFSHVPGQFHLLRKDGESLLLEGPAKDPDFAFRFTPKSIDRLSAVASGDVGDFGIELLECVLSDDPELQVGLRVLGGYTRLLFRGYVGLFFKGGPRLLSHANERGIGNVSDLRKFFKQASGVDPRWEEL
jgi:hypothetical protein